MIYWIYSILILIGILGGFTGFLIGSFCVQYGWSKCILWYEKALYIYFMTFISIVLLGIAALSVFGIHQLICGV